MTSNGERPSRYDILFEPVQIGPFQTKNRFYQVPHCNGMGYRDISAAAAMRKIKAEGGWGVVCTEQVEIHATSDIAPFIELRIWDDQDLPALKRIADAIHEGGSLAGIELAHNGMNAPNLLSRETPVGPSHLPIAPDSIDPVQAREMTKEDIEDFKRWHRNAVKRSIEIGYDIIYVYAAHGYSILQHFLAPNYNKRTDEYGGSVENRMRLLREVLEDAKEIAGDKAAIACRITVDTEDQYTGITRDDVEAVIRELGDIPDMWDFTMGNWERDSVTSRFGPEAGQEKFAAGLKKLTSKPVVGVGRFTSPDEMVRQIQSGVLDLIGAARPSIADPFLPNKIKEGRLELIRECIGCNICVTGDLTMSPIRCTQNPSMGEEWRRGWHPEIMRPKKSDARIMVVGAGPAGMEAASSLGARGYEVALLDARREIGGRVAQESKLPGLAAWNRVRDYREAKLAEMPNVEVYLESPMEAEDLMEAGFEHLIIATGAEWRRDGIGRWHTNPMPIADGTQVLTPDDLFAGKRPEGKKVVVYDDDYYYLGGVLAELLAEEGYDVSIATPSAQVSQWTTNTFEVNRIQRTLIEKGVERLTDTAVAAIGQGSVDLTNAYTRETTTRDADAVVLVTARLPKDDVYYSLQGLNTGGQLASIRAVGDCWAPSTIAAAVWAGRRAAEEFDEEPFDNAQVPFKREVTELAPQ